MERLRRWRSDRALAKEEAARAAEEPHEEETSEYSDDYDDESYAAETHDSEVHSEAPSHVSEANPVGDAAAATGAWLGAAWGATSAAIVTVRAQQPKATPKRCVRACLRSPPLRASHGTCWPRRRA